MWLTQLGLCGNPEAHIIHDEIVSRALKLIALRSHLQLKGQIWGMGSDRYAS